MTMSAALRASITGTIAGDWRFANVAGVAAVRDRRGYVDLIGARAYQLCGCQEALGVVGIAFTLGEDGDGFFRGDFA